MLFATAEFSYKLCTVKWAETETFIHPEDYFCQKKLSHFHQTKAEIDTSSLQGINYIFSKNPRHFSSCKTGRNVGGHQPAGLVFSLYESYPPLDSKMVDNGMNAADAELHRRVARCGWCRQISVKRQRSLSRSAAGSGLGNVPFPTALGTTCNAATSPKHSGYNPRP